MLHDARLARPGGSYDTGPGIFIPIDRNIFIEILSQFYLQSRLEYAINNVSDGATKMQYGTRAAKNYQMKSCNCCNGVGVGQGWICNNCDGNGKISIYPPACRKDDYSYSTFYENRNY